MDQTSIWLHNFNVDRTLHRLGTYVQPTTAAGLLKFLVEEENRLGTSPEEVQNSARRVREGRERIAKISNVIDGMVEHGLMDQEQLSRALSVVTNMREAQRLVEQCHEARSIPQPLSKDDIGYTRNLATKRSSSLLAPQEDWRDQASCQAWQPWLDILVPSSKAHEPLVYQWRDVSCAHTSKPWALDFTCVSLYWVARLPKKTRQKF
jgi:hypothetical protein